MTPTITELFVHAPSANAPGAFFYAQKPGVGRG
jgi:hypothetical protein